jgi:hypothetical protein
MKMLMDKNRKDNESYLQREESVYIQNKLLGRNDQRDSKLAPGEKASQLKSHPVQQLPDIKVKPETPKIVQPIISTY